MMKTVEEVKAYIDDYIEEIDDQKITVFDDCVLTERNLNKAFQQLTGFTVKQYINSLKIEVIERMKKEFPELSFEEIFTRVNYGKGRRAYFRAKKIKVDKGSKPIDRTYIYKDQSIVENLLFRLCSLCLNPAIEYNKLTNSTITYKVDNTIFQFHFLGGIENFIFQVDYDVYSNQINMSFYLKLVNDDLGYFPNYIEPFLSLFQNVYSHNPNEPKLNVCNTISNWSSLIKGECRINDFEAVKVDEDIELKLNKETPFYTATNKIVASFETGFSEKINSYLLKNHGISLIQLRTIARDFSERGELSLDDIEFFFVKTSTLPSFKKHVELFFALIFDPYMSFQINEPGNYCDIPEKIMERLCVTANISLIVHFFRQLIANWKKERDLDEEMCPEELPVLMETYQQIFME